MLHRKPFGQEAKTIEFGLRHRGGNLNYKHLCAVYGRRLTTVSDAQVQCDF